ncbi:MAG TPA: TonB-dependent receptor plug domain-containing protein [Puia sp.]
MTACLLTSLIGYSQNVSYSGDKVRLNVVLESACNQAGYHFSFGFGENILSTRVSVHIRNRPLKPFLAEVLKGAPVDFRIENGTVTFLYKALPVPVSSSIPAPIAARIDTTLKQLDTAVFNTGYQTLTKERTTGSIDLINNTLFNRNISSNWTDRLENLTPGLLYNHGGQTANGISIPDPILIHGRSTIYANPAPLIVVDDLPYDGNPANINPGDIENITILKDGAATAIWGARAGNGVIVLTTKEGKSYTPKVVFENNMTFTPRPNLFNIHTISSPDYIALEEGLYNSGYYSPGLSMGTTPVTPVIALLQSVHDGLLSQTDANAQIESLKKVNVLNAISRYFYRSTLNNRHYLQVSGRSKYDRYFFSGGWDHDPTDLVETQYDRYTLRMQNTYMPDSLFRLDAGINFASSLQQNGNNPGYTFLQPNGARNFYPYTQLVDAKGHPLPVNLFYSNSFLQQTAQMGFMNWAYSPLGDIPAEKNTLSSRDLLANVGLHYNPLHWLSLDIKYQFESQSVIGNDLHRDTSYFTRDLINRFNQPESSNRPASGPIPAGGILDWNDQALLSHQLRAQLGYHQLLKGIHDLSAIAGYELKSLANTGTASRYYGYDPATRSSDPNIDYLTSYPQYPSGAGLIPTAPPLTQTTDHFISYFSNVTYVYRKLYVVTGSVREDLTNLFGERTNRRGVPLWSAGAAWNISNADFFPDDYHLSLKLRATYGSSGNSSALASTNTTASYSTGGISGTPYNIATIQSPANENLRWEQVNTLNIAADFSIRDTLLSGSVEYYHKNANALLTETAADPTLGLVRSPGSGSYYFGNSAAMKGKGFDIELVYRLSRKDFKWVVTGIYSYATSIVSSITAPVGPGYMYLNSNGINPVRGRPVFGVYSYPWMGLDGKGNPVGMFNGQRSTQWDSITNYTPLSGMVYNGPSQPTSFGALRNDLYYHRIGLSFNISYKFGYYFRKPSVRYSDLANNWNSSSDYSLRWQKMGDENKTHVPSAPADYVSTLSRDNFYLNSAVLAERADNIRLEDVRLQYQLSGKILKLLKLSDVIVYSTVTNVALLWKANKDGIDPYYINTPRDGRRWSLGCTVHF